MAERASEKKLTTNELIVQKLKETFDRNGDNADSGNVWVMAVAATPFCDDQNGSKNVLGEPKPTHRVRTVLRTSEPGEGANPYVDGSDFFLEVDERQQSVEFVWEEESFADAPHLHGSEVLTAIRWTGELDEALLCVRLEDPFQPRTDQTKPKDTTRQGTREGDETWT